ncbi:MAG: molybdenum cofactor guanylyltransferase [Desulfobacteraceae bacterium]|nr:molybdenum cofactor guanylyltransferase [Desulfobacteraceae bacterium]MDH3573151.1 molybdenum cofactor guanylyltransferase [Desulfobacteraceae bacterium]MDH3720366.1 molybdenum cofactor guanylyltransferase [Desulfobacteraceae bacterium]MDH3838180.1 molybdenum cofactor guanylyltransferase [Desulfobacteraceae bacterium]MDH3873266.1 molybdenum cofactor guanylyltransferase [Desulfobacteraceae bacterium]
MMKNKCTGVILAGGKNSRFSGKNKALVRIGGKRILDRIYEVFTILFDKIILVTNDPVQYMEWDFDIVTDIFPIRSSLTGIHTGLFYITTPYAFFVACDIPFIRKELIEILLDGVEPGIDIVIPETSKGVEPLCSVYSKRCFKPIEEQLEKKSLKIQRVFQKVRVKKIPEDILRTIDPDLVSLYNINTPDDLARAKQAATYLTGVSQ